MKKDENWKKYYEEEIEGEPLCYEVVENAYSFGRKTERERIINQIQKLKEKPLDFNFTATDILNKLLKIIQ